MRRQWGKRGTVQFSRREIGTVPECGTSPAAGHAPAAAVDRRVPGHRSAPGRTGQGALRPRLSLGQAVLRRRPQAVDLPVSRGRSRGVPRAARGDSRTTGGCRFRRTSAASRRSWSSSTACLPRNCPTTNRWSRTGRRLALARRSSSFGRPRRPKRRPAIKPRPPVAQTPAAKRPVRPPAAKTTARPPVAVL